MITYLLTYLNVRHSFCSAEIGACHRLQLGVVVSSFITFKMNAPQNSEKFPEFHLNVHQIPSYQTGVVSFIFSFLEYVCWTVSHSVNQYIVILLFLKYYGSYDFLQVHSLKTTQ